MMEKNDRIREELLGSIDGLTDERLNQQVEEGAWSIMQILEHLYLIEQFVAKTIEDEVENGQPKPARDKPIHLTPNRKTKVDAPKFLTPSSEFHTTVDIKQKLANSRQKLKDVVSGVDVNVLKGKATKHPAFGTLRLDQWVQFVGYHEKRHLEQIEEVKEQLTES
ncbi:DinB family protein [Salinibacillus xinjiangensis]|uniref:DUF1569 domain-containing protein n=1 Tax=Salinibacillus xinjiangensis TaxID=1229268 RepID=A0A6G1X7B2_9BACI|nr:DinB family protein [Salinibacillus xinjiangensis]MRG86796.1 DUF1569 domain-containing protein [Salinibacillus xinjiangensis]